MSVGVELFLLGLTLLLVGSALLIISLLLKTVEESSEKIERRSEVSGGGVVIVGPIPIVFGSNRRTAVIAGLIGIVLTILALVMFILMRWGA